MKRPRPDNLTDAEYRVYLLALRRQRVSLTQSETAFLVGLTRGGVSVAERRALGKIRAAMEHAR